MSKQQKKRKGVVVFTLSIGISNAEHREELDIVDDLGFEDGATDEDIESAYEDWKSNYMDGGWHMKEDDNA